MNPSSLRKLALVGMLLFGSFVAAVGQDADFTGMVTVDYQQAGIPDGYKGLHWSQFAVFRSPGCATVQYEFSYTGYCHMTDITGKSDMAYVYGENGTSREATISGDSPFVFESAVMAAAWNNDVQVTVSGYLNGVERYSRLVSLQTGFVNCRPGPVCQLSSESFPSVIPFGWYVDKITFKATGGFSDGVGEFLFPGWHQPHFIFSSIQVHLESEIQVPVDVKPGSTTNPINLKDQGVVPIAIFTSTLIDATNVDLSTVRAGRNSAPEAHNQLHLEDVNGDGRLDLVFHAQTQLLGILAGDRELCISGKTYQGQAFRGCDLITLVPAIPPQAPMSLPSSFSAPSRAVRRR